MKKLLPKFAILLLFCHTDTIITAQVNTNTYSFTESAGVYSSPATGTQLRFADSSGHADGLPIGFNFRFGDKSYSHFCISGSGMIRLGTAATTLPADHWFPRLAGTNSLAPAIAPLWVSATSNYVKYVVTGNAPYRILTVDWYNSILKSIPVNQLVSYQLKLYETTNQVEFIYDAVMPVDNSVLPMIGLSDFNSVVSSFNNVVNVLPGPPSTVTSQQVFARSYPVSQLAGKKFTFTPLCLQPSFEYTRVSMHDATFTWRKAINASSYLFQLRTSRDIPTNTVEVTDTNYTVTGLTTGTRYYCYLKNKCADTSGRWVESFFTTVACPNPYGLTVSNITVASASINWHTATGATSFLLQLRTEPNTPVAAREITGTSFNFTGLIPGTTYYVTLKTLCGDPNSSSSWVQQSFTTLSCNNPAVINIKTITHQSASFSWPAVPNVTLYEYRLSTNPQIVGSPIEIADTNLTLNNLVPGVRYYLNIQSRCMSTYAQYSGTQTEFTTATCPYPAVQSVNTSNITSRSATVNWAPVPGASGYRIQLRTSMNEPTPDIVVPGGNTTSYTATGLSPETYYYWYLRTDCGTPVQPNLSVNWLVSSFKTTCSWAEGCCPAVKNLTVSDITATSALVTWSNIADASGYVFAVRTTTQVPLGGANLSTSNYMLTNLAPGTTYYVWVKTKCGTASQISGYSDNWTMVSFNTLCSAQSVPYSESFEGQATPSTSLPMCLNRINGSGTYTWDLSAASAHSGSRSIFYSFHDPITADDWLFTPAITVQRDISYRLSFWYKGGKRDLTSSLEIKYGPTQTADMPYTIQLPAALASTDFQLVTIDFIPSISGDFNFGFHSIAPIAIPATNDGLYIDDISLDITPCNKPQFTITDVTANDAAIDWNNETTQVRDYQLKVSTVNALPAANDFITTTSKRILQNDLAAATTYYVFLRKECWPGVYSEWSVDSFNTNLNCTSAEDLPLLTSGTVSLSGKGVYTLSNCGISTQGKEKLFLVTLNKTDTAQLHITATNGRLIRYAYKAQSAGCGPEGWNCITLANTTGVTQFGPLKAGTPYLLLLDAADASQLSESSFYISPMDAPGNDEPCNAAELLVSGAKYRHTILRASSVSDPLLPAGCGTPFNTVWYKFTPPANGSYGVKIEVNGNNINPVTGSIAWYTSAGICSSSLFTNVPGSTCQTFGETGGGDIDTLPSPVLTAGATYYLMVNTESIEHGDIFTSITANPACVNNIYPADKAVDINVTNGLQLSWTASPGALSYDVCIWTNNSPIFTYNTTNTSINIPGLYFSTTYYWYVVPKGNAGTGLMCINNKTSFTTGASICSPAYQQGCNAGDAITRFAITSISSQLNNNSGYACTFGSYTDYTETLPAVALDNSDSVAITVATGNSNDYFSIWIDYNDNNVFDSSEILLSNIQGASNGVTKWIHTGTLAPGTHRLRVTMVRYETAPSIATLPCGNYDYGETEDYLVIIPNTIAARSSAVRVKQRINTTKQGDEILMISKLYPNPAGSHVNLSIQSPVKDNVSIQVINTFGITMIKQNAAVEAGHNVITINLQQLSKGTYLVKLLYKNNKQASVATLIKL